MRVLVSSSNLDELIHFFGHRQDVQTLIAASDIIVHASVEAEPFGKVIVEGMFAKKPVIATNLGGALEIIDHNVDGLLVEASNAYALAEAIRGVLSDDERAQAMAARGHTKACALFSDDAMVQTFEAIIQEVIDH